MKLGALIIATLGLLLSVGSWSEREPSFRQTAERRQDEEEIRKLIDTFSIAFNKRDAKQISELWHLDGDTRPGGRLIKGRPAIHDRYAAQLSSEAVAAATHSHPGTITIRFLRADVAIADGEYQLSGVRDEQGKELPPVRGSWTLVLTKEGDKWGFASLRTGPAPAN